MGRDEILARIRQGYEARVVDDLDGVMAIFHPEARFHLVGTPDPVPAAFEARGLGELRMAMGRLIEGFEFHEIEEVGAVVEPPCAAIHWRARIRHRPSGRLFETDLCDMWRFGEDGRALSLTQFCDTALMRSLSAA